MQAQGRGCFSVSPHFGAQVTPLVRGALQMILSCSAPFPVPRQGETGTVSPVLPPARLGQGGTDGLPGMIKDTGHHAEGKGSTKKRQRLRAALQCPPC